MSQRNPWRPIGLTFAILCATAVSAADKKEPNDGEPPLQYVLNVDGQDVPINAGQTLKVKVGDREMQFRLTPSPHRILKLPGLSLRYPANYTYESDQSDKDGPQWTLHGRHTLIIITRIKPAIEPAVAAAVNDLTSQFKDVKRSETQFSVGGRSVKVAKLDFTVVTQKLRHYIFGFSAGPAAVGGETYLMILQETPNDDGSSDGETKELLNLLDKAVMTRP